MLNQKRQQQLIQSSIVITGEKDNTHNESMRSLIRRRKCFVTDLTDSVNIDYQLTNQNQLTNCFQLNNFNQHHSTSSSTESTVYNNLIPNLVSSTNLNNSINNYFNWSEIKSSLVNCSENIDQFSIETKRIQPKGLYVSKKFSSFTVDDILNC